MSRTKRTAAFVLAALDFDPDFLCGWHVQRGVGHDGTWHYKAECPMCGRTGNTYVCDSVRLEVLGARRMTCGLCGHAAEPIEFGPIFTPLRRQS